MRYNLTHKQQTALRWIVGEVTSGNLDETFYFRATGGGGFVLVKTLNGPPLAPGFDLRIGSIEALATGGFIVQQINRSNSGVEVSRRCTLMGLAYEAVEKNFKEPEHSVVSALAREVPPEIAISLDRLRTKYPDQSKVGFLIMRFTEAPAFQRIVDAIKTTATEHSLVIVRADECQFHADLWGNVRTYLHGCAFGIAVYERIENEEPNANVGLEVGYLLAMNKPVLLLKDKTVKTLQADLAGKLYRLFDPHDARGTIPGQLTRWLEDNGIVVPGPPGMADKPHGPGSHAD